MFFDLVLLWRIYIDKYMSDLGKNLRRVFFWMGRRTAGRCGAEKGFVSVDEPDAQGFQVPTWPSLGL